MTLSCAAPYPLSPKHLCLPSVPVTLLGHNLLGSKMFRRRPSFRRSSRIQMRKVAALTDVRSRTSDMNTHQNRLCGLTSIQTCGILCVRGALHRCCRYTFRSQPIWVHVVMAMADNTLGTPRSARSMGPRRRGADSRFHRSSRFDGLRDMFCETKPFAPPRRSGALQTARRGEMPVAGGTRSVASGSTTSAVCRDPEQRSRLSSPFAGLRDAFYRTKPTVRLRRSGALQTARRGEMPVAGGTRSVASGSTTSAVCREPEQRFRLSSGFEGPRDVFCETKPFARPRPSGALQTPRPSEMPVAGGTRCVASGSTTSAGCRDPEERFRRSSRFDGLRDAFYRTKPTVRLRRSGALQTARRGEMPVAGGTRSVASGSTTSAVCRDPEQRSRLSSPFAGLRDAFYRTKPTVRLRRSGALQTARRGGTGGGSGREDEVIPSCPSLRCLARTARLSVGVWRGRDEHSIAIRVSGDRAREKGLCVARASRLWAITAGPVLSEAEGTAVPQGHAARCRTPRAEGTARFARRSAGRTVLDRGRGRGV